MDEEPLAMESAPSASSGSKDVLKKVYKVRKYKAWRLTKLLHLR